MRAQMLSTIRPWWRVVLCVLWLSAFGYHVVGEPAPMRLEPTAGLALTYCPAYSLAVMTALNGVGAGATSFGGTLSDFVELQTAYDKALQERPTTMRPFIQQMTRAVSVQSGNALKLNVEYVDGIEAFYERISALTAKDSAGLPDTGGSLRSEDFPNPVMTAFGSSGKMDYSEGILVSIFAVEAQSDATTTRPRTLLVLHSDVRVGSMNMSACELKDVVPPNPRYYPVLSKQSDYRLKSYNGKYLVMWMSRSAADPSR